MALDYDGGLETEDVILGFEIGGYDAVDFVEGGWMRMRGENWMASEELGESCGGERRFG